jgi:NAD(P)-dependent dehydrogenase (short-subunit alcohol dehydrogenase family)
MSDYQRIFITGAGSGIGRACAVLLAARGRDLFLTGRASDKLAAAADACAGAAAVHHEAGDLTRPGEAARLVEAAAAAMGGLDAVVHCAGVGLICPALATSDMEFSRVLNVNTRATFLVAQASCRLMAPAKRGRFLTIPGILGKAPMKNAAAYVASKYAVTGMIKVFSQEFQRAGLQFCLFHFGGVDTPFWDGLAMAVQRDRMIPADYAAAQIVAALEAPTHLIASEVVIQPETHQLL